jgi:hypothetical protein
VWHELWGIYVKFMSNVKDLIVNRSSLEMPDAGQRAITAIPTYLIRILKAKHSFTKSSFVTPLLVSQRLTYDTKVEKKCCVHLDREILEIILPGPQAASVTIFFYRIYKCIH